MVWVPWAFSPQGGPAIHDGSDAAASVDARNKSGHDVSKHTVTQSSKRGSGDEAEIDRGLEDTEAAGLRKDEDYVGLPLGEPFAPAVPSLAIGPFRTAGRPAGSSEPVNPAKIVIWISDGLFDGATSFG